MSLPPSPLVNRRFLLLDGIGRGGMGRVFRAFDRRDERIVALKVPRDGDRGGPDHPFCEEFRTWSTLSHPNVVRALELGRVEDGPIPPGTPYLVLENFRGRPAHRALRPGRAPYAVLRRVAGEILAALEHVHGHGVVHRDLKPGNVLIGRSASSQPRVKLTDFGLARATGGRSAPGTISGSLPYLAPEAILGGAVDGRADLYAFGVLLFHLATGRMPFRTEDARDVLRWHLSGPPADLGPARRDLPERFRRFVARLTERSAADRPADARAALALLGDPSRPGRTAAPIAGRAERAALRLAVDAARLGTRRVLRLAADAPAARAQIAELRVVAQVHGVTFRRLGPAGESPGHHPMARLVLELVLERGAGARALLERHGLLERLPFELLGGMPLLDRARADALLAATGRSSARAVAPGIASLLLDPGRRGAAVVAFDPAALSDRLVLEAAAEIVRRLSDGTGGAGGGGGLLVAVPSNVEVLNGPVEILNDRKKSMLGGDFRRRRGSRDLAGR